MEGNSDLFDQNRESVNNLKINKEDSEDLFEFEAEVEGMQHKNKINGGIGIARSQKVDDSAS